MFSASPIYPEERDKLQSELFQAWGMPDKGGKILEGIKMTPEDVEMRDRRYSKNGTD
jgi:hypothetical protein